MLSLPETGFRRSVTSKNVSRPSMGDWLEASALFGDSPFSKSDIVDALTEEGVVDRSEAEEGEGEQDLANGIAEEGLAELRDRILRSGSTVPPYQLTGDIVEQVLPWTDDPVRSFLLLLGLVPRYPTWAKACAEIGDQGVLFERVSARACAGIFKGWQVFETGWSPTDARNITNIVSELSSLLGVTGSADLDDWAERKAKDAGLDLMCFRDFADAAQGLPYYAIQCASGENWKTKLQQPSTNQWQKFLNAAFEPTRALTIPFVLDREDFGRKCLVIEGPIFDRERLMTYYERVPGNSELEDDLRTWCLPRIDLLNAM